VHVIIATDGSKQSLTAARTFKSFVDPEKVSDISVIAVVRPYSAVAFADDISTSGKTTSAELSFRKAAQSATERIAEEFSDWGPKVHTRIRGGSPANELIKAAKQLNAGLIVIAAGGRGLSDTVLMGSTAQLVQHYAPCPVLVVRPAPRQRKKKA